MLRQQRQMVLPVKKTSNKDCDKNKYACNKDTVKVSGMTGTV